MLNPPWTGQSGFFPLKREWRVILPLWWFSQAATPQRAAWLHCHFVWSKSSERVSCHSWITAECVLALTSAFVVFSRLLWWAQDVLSIPITRLDSYENLILNYYCTSLFSPPPPLCRRWPILQTQFDKLYYIIIPKKILKKSGWGDRGGGIWFLPYFPII